MNNEEATSPDVEIPRSGDAGLQSFINQPIDTYVTRLIPQPHQKLRIPLWPQQWALDQPADLKSIGLRKAQYIQQDLSVDLWVADDAIAARDILFPRFELRLDERNHTTFFFLLFLIRK